MRTCPGAYEELSRLLANAAAVVGIAAHLIALDALSDRQRVAVAVLADYAHRLDMEHVTLDAFCPRA